MHVYGYVLPGVCIDMCVFMYVCIPACVCLLMYLYVCLYVYMHACLCLLVYYLPGSPLISEDTWTKKIPTSNRSCAIS